MDVVTACKTRLLAVPAVVGLSTGGIHKWKLENDVTHQGTAAVAIRSGGSWRTTLQTSRFPRLHIRVHADVSRDLDGVATAEDAETKAMVLWQAIDDVLHVPYRFDEMWGAVRVLGSHRESDPVVIERPGERTVLLQVVYDWKVG